MNRTTSTKALPGWGVPLLFTVFSACVAPGKTPALGVELGSCGPEGLIDDGEDGNNQNKTTGGRGGYWYTFKDRTGSTTVFPEAGEEGGAFAMSERGANGSKFAAHVKGHVGEGDIVFGAMGMNFVDPMEP